MTSGQIQPFCGSFKTAFHVQLAGENGNFFPLSPNEMAHPNDITI